MNEVLKKICGNININYLNWKIENHLLNGNKPLNKELAELSIKKTFNILGYDADKININFEDNYEIESNLMIDINFGDNVVTNKFDNKKLDMVLKLAYINYYHELFY